MFNLSISLQAPSLISHINFPTVSPKCSSIDFTSGDGGGGGENGLLFLCEIDRNADVASCISSRPGSVSDVSAFHENSD